MSDRRASLSPRALKAFQAAALPNTLEVRAAAGSKPAELLVYGEIGPWDIDAKAFARALSDAGPGPLVLRLNSPGGSVFDGLAMFEAIRRRGEVEVVVDGVAASAAAFLSMAADRVTMAEHAMLMIHRCWCLVVGSRDELIEQAAVMEKIDQQQVAMFSAKTGKDSAEVDAMLAAETWFTSSEALAHGFADAILSPPEKPTKAAAEGPIIASADDLARRKRLLRLAEATGL